MVDKLLKIIDMVIAKDATAIEKIKDYINNKENKECNIIRCPMCGAEIDASSVCQSDDLDERLDGNILVIKSQ